MTYSEFINTLSDGCTMFFNGIFTIANSLMSNYIVITLLGLSLFSFVIYTLVNCFQLFHKDKNDLDNYKGGKK